MILRKPYAFLAKHFRFIHIILSILLIYLTYRSYLIFQFFNDAVSSTTSLVGQDFTSSLFNVWMYIIPFLWILLSIIILSLMFTKKKPFTFYAINILFAIVTFAFYIAFNNVITDLQIKLIDLRSLRAYRDFSMISLFAQGIVTVMVIVRATGFDIKKFNFGEDLSGIEVKEEDREEFELNIEVDTDLAKRKARRGFRYAKYIYVENKYLINLVASIVIVIFSYIFVMNTFVYNKSYGVGTQFIVAGVNTKVKNIYYVTEDYKGNSILEEGKTLVVVSLDLKKVGDKKRVLDTASAILHVGGYKFYHKNEYRDKLIDLGKSYGGEELTKDVQNYILIFEIPTSYLNKKMAYEYSDKNTFGPTLHHAVVKISGINLEKNFKNIDLTEIETTLKESILKDVKLQIKDGVIASNFTHHYSYCPKTGECYDSVEYVKPNIENQYEKTLLKLTGSIDFGSASISGVESFYQFIKAFGSMHYTLNGQEKTQLVDMRRVSVIHKNSDEEYYIEVLKEIEQAEKIELVLHIRNIDYHYKLK